MISGMSVGFLIRPRPQSPAFRAEPHASRSPVQASPQNSSPRPLPASGGFTTVALPRASGLNRSRRNGRAAIGREQPQLIDLFRGQRRQIAGKENQAAIAPLVDRLASRLRLVAGGNQFESSWLPDRPGSRPISFACSQLCSLVAELSSQRSNVAFQRRIPPQQSDCKPEPERRGPPIQP